MKIVANELEIKEITKSLKEIESQIKSIPSAEIKRDQLGDLRRELEAFRTKQLSSKSLTTLYIERLTKDKIT